MDKKNSLIGVIGDLHMKEFLSYSDNISDNRVSEKKDILDFIVKSFSDCKHIVILGDVFNGKNNSSETNRSLVEFLESFGNKDLYIISGNHDKRGDGKTSIDFISEVKKENWHVFTKPGEHKIGELNAVFLPYMLTSEVEAETNEEASKKIVKMVGDGDILFTHHAISGTSFHGIPTDILKEAVLKKENLEKKFKLIMAGHIHEPQEKDKVVVVGSVFTDIVGEREKFAWKVGTDLSVEKIKLPCREILKIENPTDEDLSKIKKNSIIKVIITKKSIKVSELKEKLSKFDSFMLIEDYPSKRKKIHIKEGSFNFEIENLLEIYAKEKGLDVKDLLNALKLINE